MKLSEYASFDAMGIAALIKSGEVSADEIRNCALRAIDVVNGEINAVIETYDDPVPAPADTAPEAPFAGVPYLIKDVGAHFGGLKCEFCSRLCEGMVAAEDSHYAGLVRRSGVSIVGRSNTPEFSMSGTSENVLYGNTSTPWKKGYSSNGSSGGSAAAVAAGVVPMAHGSDIGGSIRGPAAWCGGVGLKPSRARISSGPNYDEWGHGMSMSFVQTKTMRDTAAMLDHLAVPQPGDPFVIARAPNPYTTYLNGPAKPLKLAFSAARIRAEARRMRSSRSSPVVSVSAASSSALASSMRISSASSACSVRIETRSSATEMNPPSALACTTPSGVLISTAASVRSESSGACPCSTPRSPSTVRAMTIDASPDHTVRVAATRTTCSPVPSSAAIRDPSGCRPSSSPRRRGRHT